MKFSRILKYFSPAHYGTFAVTLILAFLATIFRISESAELDSPDLHRIAIRQAQPGRITNQVCANGGQYLNSLCIADYNCNRGFANSGQECIRGRCCRQTSIQKFTANIRRAEDEQKCRSGGFYMNKECRTVRECNLEDPYYNQRAIRFQECVNNLYCCSTVYRDPQRLNDPCINGGRYQERRCQNDVDCGSTNANNVRDRQNARIICVERSCCTRANQDFLDESYTNNFGGTNTGGSEFGDDEIGLGGADPGQNTQLDTQGTKGGGSDFGDDVIDLGDADPGQNTQLDNQRGRNTCQAFGYNEYLGRRCIVKSECASRLLDSATFSQVYCAGGYCCRGISTTSADNNQGGWDAGLSGSGLDDNLPREAACDYRGYNLGTECLRSPDCDLVTPLITRVSVGPRRRVCIRDRCCSVPLLIGVLPGSGTSLDPAVGQGGGGQVPAGVAGFCSRGGSFSRFTGNLCTPLSPALCPTVNVYDAQARIVQMPVRCIQGYCCANELPSTSSSSSSSSGRLNDPQENPGGWLPGRPANSRAFCYDGSETSAQCRSKSDCVGMNTGKCIQGLCCLSKVDERNFVCGGLSAVSDCSTATNNNQCDDGLVCTSSSHCCECHFGQPQPNVKCNTNVPCKPGYECTTRGYCCPRCKDNSQPYGSCFSGKCASGFACQPGNICCQSTF